MARFPSAVRRGAVIFASFVALLSSNGIQAQKGVTPVNTFGDWCKVKAAASLCPPPADYSKDCGNEKGRLQPVNARGKSLATILDSLKVKTRWSKGTQSDWLTGEYTGPSNPLTLKPGSTHSGCFAASAAYTLGIYLLHPPQHPQRKLAKSQAEWLRSEHAALLGWQKVVGSPQASASVTAQNLANQGHFVVAVPRNQKHRDHIAVVYPFEKCLAAVHVGGPQVVQAGDCNYVNVPASLGFNCVVPQWGEHVVDYFFFDTAKKVTATNPSTGVYATSPGAGSILLVENGIRGDLATAFLIDHKQDGRFWAFSHSGVSPSLQAHTFWYAYTTNFSVPVAGKPQRAVSYRKLDHIPVSRILEIPQAVGGSAVPGTVDPREITSVVVEPVHEKRIIFHQREASTPTAMDGFWWARGVSSHSAFTFFVSSSNFTQISGYYLGYNRIGKPVWARFTGKWDAKHEEASGNLYRCAGADWDTCNTRRPLVKGGVSFHWTADNPFLARLAGTDQKRTWSIRLLKGHHAKIFPLPDVPSNAQLPPAVPVIPPALKKELQQSQRKWRTLEIKKLERLLGPVNRWAESGKRIPQQALERLRRIDYQQWKKQVRAIYEEQRKKAGVLSQSALEKLKQVDYKRWKQEANKAATFAQNQAKILGTDGINYIRKVHLKIKRRIRSKWAGSRRNRRKKKLLIKKRAEARRQEQLKKQQQQKPTVPGQKQPTATAPPKKSLSLRERIAQIYESGKRKALQWNDKTKQKYGQWKEWWQTQKKPQLGSGKKSAAAGSFSNFSFISLASAFAIISAWFHLST